MCELIHLCSTNSNQSFIEADTMTILNKHVQMYGVMHKESSGAWRHWDCAGEQRFL